MANPWTGEVVLTIDGQERVLKLTLGALVELEAALGTDSLVGLVGRFETGAFAARDVLSVLVAGLRGGGMAGQIDLAHAEIAGGPMAAASAAGQLIVRAFSLPQSAAE